MNDGFNWWLLIVGLVVGAGLVWLVVADSRRTEADVTERERDGEAVWIADAMKRVGRPVADADVLDILRLHESYLDAPPPDDPDELDVVEPGDGRAGTTDRAPMAHRAAEEPLSGDRA